MRGRSDERRQQTVTLAADGMNLRLDVVEMDVIEGYNRPSRKAAKNKTSLSTDEAVCNAFYYLARRDIAAKPR